MGFVRQCSGDACGERIKCWVIESHADVLYLHVNGKAKQQQDLHYGIPG